MSKPHIYGNKRDYRKIDIYLRTIPTDVRMGRGDSIRSGDMRFTFELAGKAVTFTRVE